MAETKEKIPEGVQKYLQSLMVEKGLDSLPGTIQGDMLYDLYTRYNSFLMTNFLAGMNQAAQNGFNDLLAKKPSQHQVELYLKKNTKYEKIVKDTTEEFHDIFVGVEKSAN